jgi:hypothetical protein
LACAAEKAYGTGTPQAPGSLDAEHGPAMQPFPRAGPENMGAPVVPVGDVIGDVPGMAGRLFV